MILQNGASLAYLGDSVYELKIRNYLINKGLNDVNKLHKLATKYTSGQSQSKIISYLLDNNLLQEEEINYYKRGRNSSHSANGRNIKAYDYRNATGFEALIGFLFLSEKTERLEEIVKLAINLVEEG